MDSTPLEDVSHFSLGQEEEEVLVDTGTAAAGV
jgi:hypothetical protein